MAGFALPGAVEPDFEEGTVVREQLDELCDEEVVVFKRPVSGFVPIPGREVEAELQAGLTARLGELFNDVPTVFVVPRASCNRKVGVLGRP